MTNGVQPPDESLVSAARAKEAHRLALLAKPNVIALDVGYRVRGGETTDERVVIAYVTQKVDRSMLDESQLIPPTLEIDGSEMGVDVQEGAIDQPHIFSMRTRPLIGGASVGPTGGTGTLGVCVRLADSKTYILSCNHVLADAIPPVIGDNILQPGPADGGILANDVVATLSRVVPINFGSIVLIGPGGTPITVPIGNTVDAAVAQVAANINGNREIYWVGYPMSVSRGQWDIYKLTYLIGRRVCKMGRTTEFTTGTIISPWFDGFVGPYANGRNAFFVDQLRILGDNSKPFSDFGDSGSIVVDIATKEPLGLLFGGQGNFTSANRLPEVMDALQIPQL